MCWLIYFPSWESSSSQVPFAKDVLKKTGKMEGPCEVLKLQSSNQHHAAFSRLFLAIESIKLVFLRRSFLAFTLLPSNWDDSTNLILIFDFFILKEYKNFESIQYDRTRTLRSLCKWGLKLICLAGSSWRDKNTCLDHVDSVTL